MRLIALLYLSGTLVGLGGAGARAAQEADPTPSQVKRLLAQADQARGDEARRLRAEATRRLLDLSPARVRELLGPPDRVARQVLYRRYLEQWAYDRPAALSVLFEGRKGQEPRSRGVRWDRPEKP
jgi:hypothetical protein